jgi:hypothetical protein
LSFDPKDYVPLIRERALGLGAHDDAVEILTAEWLAFCSEHPAVDPEEVSLEVDLWPSRQGLVTVVLEPGMADMALTVKLADPETGEVSQPDPVPPLAWAKFMPEPRREADRKFPLNAKCPCGSGKKYKKCCAQVRVAPEETSETPEKSCTPATSGGE